MCCKGSCIGTLGQEATGTGKRERERETDRETIQANLKIIQCYLRQSYSGKGEAI